MPRPTLRLLTPFTVVAGLLISLVPLVPQAAEAAEHGAWNVTCPYSHSGADDPIVFPGKPGLSHEHTFYANSTTNAATTEQTLLASGPSTCERGFQNADHSAYWIPALYRSGQELKGSQQDVTMTIYYRRSGGAQGDKVTAFPQGLRMIAGDATATAPTRAASFRCINDKNGGIQTKSGNTFPSCDAGEGLLESVTFPECWDGKNLDSADHKSHMVYAANSRKSCPADHPVKVPQVTFEAIYHHVNGPASQFKLSSGDPFTLHGDFFAAWDNNTQKALVDKCANVDRNCTFKKLSDLNLGVTPGGNGQVLGTTAATPAPNNGPAPSSHTMPGMSMAPTVTTAHAGKTSDLPDTGPVSAASSVIGLTALASAAYVYRRRRHSLLDALRRR
jgi:hypothetical protein